MVGLVIAAWTVHGGIAGVNRGRGGRVHRSGANPGILRCPVRFEKRVGSGTSTVAARLRRPPRAIDPQPGPRPRSGGGQVGGSPAAAARLSPASESVHRSDPAGGNLAGPRDKLERLDECRSRPETARCCPHPAPSRRATGRAAQVIRIGSETSRSAALSHRAGQKGPRSVRAAASARPGGERIVDGPPSLLSTALTETTDSNLS